MKLWPKSTTRRIVFLIGLAVGAYVCSYLPLSLAGEWRFSESGKLHYTQGPLAVSDIIVWTPRYCWYQYNYRFINGKHGSRGNRLGYFYAPLILLDRALWHKTKSALEPDWTNRARQTYPTRRFSLDTHGSRLMSWREATLIMRYQFK